MIFTRITGYLLPQVLIILFEAGVRDLLGGWNQTNEAFATIISLFLLSPLIIGYVLVRDTILLVTKRNDTTRIRLLAIWLLDVVVFVEALAIDFYLLTQIRM